MVDQATKKPGSVTPPAAEPEVKTFTEEQVQQRVTAATTTLQKSLDLSNKARDEAIKGKDDFERQLTQANSTIGTLKKAGEFAEDAEAFADYKTKEEAKLDVVRHEHNKRAFDLTTAEVAGEYGVPKEALLGASTVDEVLRRAMEHMHANPPTVADPADPSSPADPGAATPVPAGDPAPPAAETPQVDRGGAGNAGVGTPKQSGIEKIEEAIWEQPGWDTFRESLPD